jgi:hypothetical protein
MKSFRTWLENQSDFLKDTNGNPSVFYHATNADFSQFNPAYTTGQMGFHFGTEAQSKSLQNDSKYLFKTHLKIKNPLRLEDQGAWQGSNVVSMVNKALGIKLNPSASDRTIAQAIRAAGYDGVVYKNNFEKENFEDDEEDSYIVFSPEQIHILEKSNKKPH